MRLSIFTTLLISFILLTFACRKNLPSVLSFDQTLYNSLCESANGNLDVKIDGNTWGNSCAIAYGVQLGQQPTEDSIYLSIISYTGDGIYLNNGSFEWFSMGIFIDNGVGVYSLNEDTGNACYSAGLIEWSGGQNNPNAELSEEAYYCTDNNLNDNNSITIESISGTRVTGKFDFTGFNENEESLKMNGNFDVEYEE